MDPTATPAMLTVDDILAAADTPEEQVFVREWNGYVKIKGLTKQQQYDIRLKAMRANQQGDLEPDEFEVQKQMWLEAVIEPRFTMENLGPLMQKNAGAIDRVLARVLVLSGMDSEATKRKEATFPPAAGVPVRVRTGGETAHDGSPATAQPVG